jgi:hypothetical protein
MDVIKESTLQMLYEILKTFSIPVNVDEDINIKK